MTTTRPSAPGSLTYRPDIDGLRAVAVVPVVLYHFRVPGFGGGFVGVDVFFVISGFLITSLIFGEMRAGEFSILRFYERRVRRIFPALFAVVLATLAVGVAFFFPRDLLRLAESAAATALFASNFDFWLQSGYFDVGADLKPLLHTWSLAVEEQFYLIFPALLRLLHTSKRRSLLGFVVALAAVSFALSLWAVSEHPSAAFYLAPYRTWEIMLGAILALGDFPQPKSPLLADSLSFLGLAAIAWAVFGFTAATTFPGANALFPCLGAATLIYAGSAKGTVWRVLASRPFVFVGLISYSLYLWHWPIHVYSIYVARAAVGWTWSLALIALSFGLAILSWRFVEQPFRRRHVFPQRAIFRYGGSVTAATLLLSGLLFSVHGLPQRFPAGVQRIRAEADDIEPRRHECFNRSAEDVQQGRICTIGDARAPAPTFLVWGDSHGDALLPALNTDAASAYRKGLFVAHGRCPPLLHLSLTDEPTGRCAQLNDAVFRLAMRKDIKEVILVARWAYYDQGVGYGLDASEIRHLIDLDPPPTPDRSQHAGFARVLERTVLALLKVGKRVVIVAPVPEPGFDVPEVLARDELYGAGEHQTLAASDFHARDAFVSIELARLHAKYGVLIIDPASALCASDDCVLQRQGRPLYADHHHLSVFGAMQLSGLFTRAFEDK